MGKHSHGSRALEAVLGCEGSSSTRQGLACSLAPLAPKLARDRCGAHVLEAAFRAAPMAQKEEMLTALSPIEADLRASSHGGVLLKKLRYASRSRLTSDLGEVD
jgi:hypothetical protein